MNMKYYEYAGMSYEQASREAERLLGNKGPNGGWYKNIDRLIALKQIMDHGLDRRAAEQT